MKTVRRKIALTALGAVLIAIIFFCFSRSVYSQGRSGLDVSDRESMDESEDEYIEQVAELMKEYGCEYSGITMTKVFEADGSRSYQVLIHHRNLSFLSEKEMQELEKRLTEFSLPFGDAKFTYGFSCPS